MPGLHLRTLKLDPGIALFLKPGNQWKGRECSSSVARFCSLRLKQVLKNARVGRSRGLGQLSSCVADAGHRGQSEGPSPWNNKWQLAPTDHVMCQAHRPGDPSVSSEFHDNSVS